MDIEYEATFLQTNKEEMQAKLKSIKATLIKPETLMKREVFLLPKGHEIPHGWLRVRDEGDCITMSFKITDNGAIESQKEICLKVDNFEKATDFLKQIGCQTKAFQENKREIWQKNGVEICLDEWPFLEPYTEIEGPDEESVKGIAKELEFDYAKALFCSVGKIYSLKYGLSEDIINNYTSEIVFGKNNPFLSKN